MCEVFYVGVVLKNNIKLSDWNIIVEFLKWIILSQIELRKYIFI